LGDSDICLLAKTRTEQIVDVPNMLKIIQENEEWANEFGNSLFSLLKWFDEERDLEDSENLPENYADLELDAPLEFAESSQDETKRLKKRRVILRLPVPEDSDECNSDALIEPTALLEACQNRKKGRRPLKEKTNVHKK
jgi:hypothetical protein